LKTLASFALSNISPRPTELKYSRDREHLLSVLLPDDEFIEVLNKLCIASKRDDLRSGPDIDCVNTWRGVATPADLMDDGPPKSSRGT
jgi:hypothetical protein